MLLDTEYMFIQMPIPSTKFDQLISTKWIFLLRFKTERKDQDKNKFQNPVFHLVLPLKISPHYTSSWLGGKCNFSVCLHGNIRPQTTTKLVVPMQGHLTLLWTHNMVHKPQVCSSRTGKTSTLFLREYVFKISYLALKSMCNIIAFESIFSTAR